MRAFRDSGDPLIRNIPANWKVVPARYLCQITTGSEDSGNATDDGAYPFYVRGREVLRIGKYSFDCEAVLTPGDGQGGTGKVFHYVDGRFEAHQRVYVFKDFQNVLGRYFYYFLSTFLSPVALAGSSTVTMESIRRPLLASLQVALPPLCEQHQIIDFLDGETARIDRLIEEQRRLIDMLKERRRTVLKEGLSRGASHSIPVTASGVQWIGEVPSHWTVVAIKWLTAVKRGASPRPIDDPIYFDEDGEWSWVRIADVTSAGVSGVLRSTTQKLSDLGSSLSVKVEPGDLFVSIAGTVGKPCIAGIKCCIHDGFVYFPDLQLNPRWLFRIFEAGECYAGLGKLGTQLNLNTDTIGAIKIPVPPADELDQLLTYLNEQTSKIDSLILEAEKFIDLVRERRSALITAAVTGQIDVREVA